MISEDPDELWAVGVSVWERYNGPYTDEVKPLVEFMLNKRVAVKLEVDRIRSWDHRKLGMDPDAGRPAPPPSSSEGVALAVEQQPSTGRVRRRRQRSGRSP